MADTKISALPQATSLAGTEETVVVQSGTTKRIADNTVFSWDNAAWSGWVLPNDASWAGNPGLPLTSTNWDGDARSTTAKTLIDLSTEFGVPAGARMVKVRLTARDSGSAAGSGLFFMVSPNNTASSGPLWVWLGGVPNDEWRDAADSVPCDSNGDIYFQILASGAGLMDCHIQIWGYLL